ncbi:hypothetical protein TNIN_484981 [Trichonephila inaurata madagascariensis]|uniref:Uncharacterized protein n=1 Tax=Trichonephila inaurata madagascariensis TaxID=2747483 RepID=A0A8X6XAU3_9ARAC|nr:hypothetical protein TNIN_484981 [Trichonephila inaurata madagascariensis]
MSKLTSCSVLSHYRLPDTTIQQSKPPTRPTFGQQSVGRTGPSPNATTEAICSTTQELITPSWSSAIPSRHATLTQKGQSDGSTTGTRPGDVRQEISHRDSDSFSKRPLSGIQLH